MKAMHDRKLQLRCPCTESKRSQAASKQSDIANELEPVLQVQLLYVTGYLLFVTAYSQWALKSIVQTAESTA